MDDGDLDYLNDIRDAQMFQRAPRHKCERLDPLFNIMMMLSL